MPLVIQTNTLIDILDTLMSTSGSEPGMDGALLYTATGPFGDEPGNQSLLAGLATNGTVSSHYYMPVDGGAFKTQFWPAYTAGLVASAFGARAAELEEHVLKVHQLADNQVMIEEYDTPPDGVQITFNVAPADAFPTAGVIRLLEGHVATPRLATDGETIQDGAAELWNMAGLGLLLRLSKRWKVELLVEKTVTNGVCRVAMAGMDNWVGAVVPVTPAEASTLNDGVAVSTHLQVPGV